MARCIGPVLGNFEERGWPRYFPGTKAEKIRAGVVYKTPCFLNFSLTVLPINLQNYYFAFNVYIVHCTRRNHNSNLKEIWFLTFKLQHPLSWWHFQHISRLLKRSWNRICIKQFVHQMWVKMCQRYCAILINVFSPTSERTKSNFLNSIGKYIKLYGSKVEVTKCWGKRGYWCFPPESSSWWHERIFSWYRPGFLSATEKSRAEKYLKAYIPPKNICSINARLQTLQVFHCKDSILMIQYLFLTA